MINDLPGAPWYDVSEDGKGLAANPRAVVTAGPGMLRDADETNSAATMPMPKKRRLNPDDDEVTSHNNGSPNDLVEVPSVVAGSQPSVAAAPSTSAASAQPQARKAAAVATAPVAQAAEQVSESKQPAAAPAAAPRPAPSAAAPTAAAAADGSGASDPVVKAVLVAKVLTKSDASSKRVILPRIAIEANLPQLASQQVFNFSAQDNAGHTWPLCIKAWANGQNPKPVYVLEQVGEIMKQEKLIAGDALAVLASQDGKFYIEWNTEQARTAAARPTYSAFTFTAAAASAAVAHATPAAAAAKPGPSAVAVKAEQQQEERTVSPAAPGAYMPGSPCQLLVMGHPTMTKESYLLDDSQELVGSAGAPVAVSQSPAGSAAGVAPAGPSAPQPSPAVGVNGTLHQGGFLVCPRTPGCTRPAGHQGWCLGHKGFKKRGRN